MDPTKTTPAPEDKAPDTAAQTMAVPGAEASASTAPQALDFTGGLSMADSLASAQDNLTSAGMAAKDMGSATLGLDQIGSSDPSATMERPDEPLIPAAPVPGSIGSVTSGPAMADPAAQPVAAAAPVMNEAPAAAPYNPFAAPAAEGQPAAATAPVAQPAQPDMTQASSTNVPTALQPKTSKFSMKSGKTSALTWILGIMAGVFAIAMIVFLVLWIQSSGKEKVVYVPNVPVQPDPVQTNAVCVMERAAGEEDGMEGLAQLASTVALNFSDDVLTNYDVSARYTFGEAGQAEAARPLFATMVSLFMAVGAENGDSPLSASFDVMDNVVALEMNTDVTKALETDGVTLDLPTDEATGDYLLDQASITNYLGGQGYTCE